MSSRTYRRQYHKNGKSAVQGFRNTYDLPTMITFAPPGKEVSQNSAQEFIKLHNVQYLKSEPLHMGENSSNAQNRIPAQPTSADIYLLKPRIHFH